MKPFTSYLAKGVPAVVTLGLYFLIVVLYFAPQFSGDVLPQHDVVQYEGMAHDILAERAQTGEDPQWTGGMFGGMPAYLINVAYPARLVKNWIGPLMGVVDTPAAFILFAMVAMWLMLRMMRINNWVATAGGLAWGLSTYFFLIIGAGHITKMWALVFAPLMMGGAWFTLRRNLWVGAALTALFTSLEIGANHPQITYYFLCAMALFWLSEGYYAFRESRLKEFSKRTLALLGAGILAVGSNFSPLWYTMQHTPETTRGGSELASAEDGAEGLDLHYATDWSYGPAESWNLLIPDFMGGTSMDGFARDGEVADTLSEFGLSAYAPQLPTYWGDQPFTAGPTYLGAVVIFLALFALFILPPREKWWVVAASLLALLLAWGRHFMPLTELMFNLLPGYDKFRTVSMFLVVVEWTMPLLAALGMAALWQGKEPKKMRRGLYWAGGIVGGLSLVMALGGDLLFDFGREASQEQMTALYGDMFRQSGMPEALDQGLDIEMGQLTAEAMAAERFSIMRKDAWRSFVLILLSVVALWLYLRGGMKRGVWISLMSLLIIVDLLPVNMRYLSHEHFVEAKQTKILPTAADLKIMADGELGYRVLNLTVSPFNDATTSYFHRSIGGYHGAKLARYQDLIERHLNQLNEEVLDMLNTRYVILDRDSVWRRETANGAAWFVDHLLAVDSAEEEISRLGEIDTRTAAIIRREDLDKADHLEPATLFSEEEPWAEIRLVEYRPNYLRYESYATEPSVAIFSEIYYEKGWRLYVDGEEYPYFRADYVLRGAQLPAGEHLVEWRFRAPSWRLVEGITLFSSLLILLGLLLCVGVALRRRALNDDTTQNEPQ